MPCRGGQRSTGNGARIVVAHIAAALALAVSIVTVSMVSMPAWALELDSRFGRWSIGGYAEAYAVFRTDRDSQRQRPAGIFSLTLTGDVHPKARLVLDTRTTFGGPPEHADGLDIYNLSDTFQNISPSVEINEGYLDLFLGPVDLRIGKQKFAWGQLDTVQPTDVVNPQRWDDPFVMDEQDTKIGVPALRASYFLPPLGRQLPTDLRITVIWIPVPISTRFPLEEERWFSPATSVEEAVRVPPNVFDIQGVPIPNPVSIRNTLRTENRRPPQQLDEGAIAMRVAGFYRSVDWSLYYYDGMETAPAFDFTSSVVWPVAGQFPPPDRPIRLRAKSVLLPRFDRIRLIGGDLAAERAGFTLRAEGAYGMDRLLPGATAALLAPDNLRRALGPAQTRKLLQGERITPDLGDLFAVRDTVRWGVGIDYFYRGWTPLVQMNQTIILDPPSQELLINDVDTQLLFILRKSFLAERLETEWVAFQGLERGYTLGMARFTYELTDNWRVRLGYLLIAGSRRTVVGQYHDNDEGFAQVRYSY
jgi:hypothetical protein